MRSDGEPQVLVDHLKNFLGFWTADRRSLVVSGCELRSRPGWDGNVRPFVGVIDQDGFGVLSVESAMVAPVQSLLNGCTTYSRGALEGLPAVLGMSGKSVFEGVFRYCFAPRRFDRLGEWFDASAAIVPQWLHPFGGEVLLALDEDKKYLGGVGIKRHDEFGREIAVVTEEAARGRGIARSLVAQATERILEEGRAPTYLHAPGNLASARVAESVGFLDRGWKIVGIG
ncbi:MAG: GNAT family N-acetyltransferase [Acidimicrobiales bacterium]